MARVMNLKMISKETIKPSSPTPLHLKSYNLCLFDQLSPSVYVSLVLFYRHFGNDDNDLILNFTEMSQCLKRSLSITLTRFFPLAGKIKDNVSVDCNDQGVDYFEAHVDCYLDDILEQSETDALNKLLPVDDSSYIDVNVGCPLMVQTNLFKCGGIAIGVSVSHKLSDAATLSSFLKAWSATAGLESSEEAVIPDFTAATLFPSRKDIPLSRPASISGHFITKRFLFDASKIVALKSKAASASVPTPTRVEAVSALIWKCAMTAARSNSEREAPIRLCVLGHGVNMRKRIVPPLSENSFGNIVGFIAAMTDESETNLESLVDNIRKQITNFNDTVKFESAKWASEWSRSFEESKQMAKICGIEIYSCTSWCRFPFYEVDFGWGKPAGLGSAMSGLQNLIILMDARDGNGVHAYVSLTQAEMALFEHDPDLLAFASLNPSF